MWKRSGREQEAGKQARRRRRRSKEEEEEEERLLFPQGQRAGSEEGGTDERTDGKWSRWRAMGARETGRPLSKALEFEFLVYLPG